MVSNSLEFLASFHKYSSIFCNVLSHEFYFLIRRQSADEIGTSEVLDDTTCFVPSNEVVSQATDELAFHSWRVCRGGANELLESLACRSAVLHSGLKAFDDENIGIVERSRCRRHLFF